MDMSQEQFYKYLLFLSLPEGGGGGYGCGRVRTTSPGGRSNAPILENDVRKKDVILQWVWPMILHFMQDHPDVIIYGRGLIGIREFYWISHILTSEKNDVNFLR